MTVECDRLEYTLYYNIVSVYLLKILSNNLDELIFIVCTKHECSYFEISVATRFLQFSGAKEDVAQFENKLVLLVIQQKTSFFDFIALTL